MSTRLPPACPFGSKCYRKNPEHFKEYTHHSTTTTPATAPPPAPAATATTTPHAVTSTVYEVCVMPTSLSSTTTVTTAASASPSTLSTSPAATTAVPSPMKSPRSVKRDRDESSSAAAIVGGSTVVTDWSSFFALPSPRVAVPPPSSSTFSGGDLSLVESLFEMPFPAEMIKVLSVASSLAASSGCDVLDAFPGWRLVGPFEVLAKRITFFYSDAAKWCYYRYRYDPPEVQTFAVRHTPLPPPPHALNLGLTTGPWQTAPHRLAFHRDDPKELPTMIVGAPLDPLHASFDVISHTVVGALMLLLISPGDSSSASTSSPSFVACNALRNAVCPPSSTKEGSGKSAAQVYQARKKRIQAMTVHKLGIQVPYDTKSELGYRPMMMPLAQFTTLINAWNDRSSHRITPKQLDTIAEQFQWADIANDECDFGLSLEIGMNLFSLVQKRNEVLYHTWRVLEMAYTLLNRSLFRHILQCHLSGLAGDVATPRTER